MDKKKYSIKYITETKKLLEKKSICSYSEYILSYSRGLVSTIRGCTTVTKSIDAYHKKILERIRKIVPMVVADSKKESGEEDKGYIELFQIWTNIICDIVDKTFQDNAEPDLANASLEVIKNHNRVNKGILLNQLKGMSFSISELLSYDDRFSNEIRAKLCAALKSVRDTEKDEFNQKGKIFMMSMSLLNRIPMWQSDIRSFLRICYMYPCVQNKFTKKTHYPSIVFRDHGLDKYRMPKVLHESDRIDNENYTFYFTEENFNAIRRVGAYDKWDYSLESKSKNVRFFDVDELALCLKKYKFLNIEYNVNMLIIKSLQSEDKVFGLDRNLIDTLTLEDIITRIVEENLVITDTIHLCVEILNSIEDEVMQLYFYFYIIKDLKPAAIQHKLATEYETTVSTNYILKKLKRLLSRFADEHKKSLLAASS